MQEDIDRLYAALDHYWRLRERIAIGVFIDQEADDWRRLQDSLPVARRAAADAAQAVAERVGKSTTLFKFAGRLAHDEAAADLVWPDADAELQVLKSAEPTLTEEQVIECLESAGAWQKHTFETYKSKQKAAGKPLLAKSMRLAFWLAWLPKDKADLLRSQVSS